MNRVAVAVILFVFLALRIALLVAREPFFDELFTMWISRQSFAGILRSLQLDSGPPLYYFVVHVVGVGGRWLSLFCATIGLGALLHEKQYVAAGLIAVFPPAVLFAVDARGYAMCAMFVTIGVLALNRDRYGWAAAAFVLAAYTHYFGFFFFPLLIKRWRVFAIAMLAFAPGLWLAFQQPKEATAWMTTIPQWPDALFVRPPIVLLIAFIVLIVASLRWNRFTLMTLVPIACALALMVVGRPVYLPMRFESIVAAPLVLAITASKPHRALVAAIALASIVICSLGIRDHAERPPDDYRAAATWAATNVPPNAPLFASGYLYLETITQRAANALPPEQATHPGWRAQPRGGISVPRGEFYWIGESAAPELSILRRARNVERLYVNSRAVVARVR